jgi:N-acetylneuraminate lyase
VNEPRLTGFLAAAHTPFHPDGSLDVDAVDKQAAHLLAHRVPGVFIMGTTGECHSLSREERLSLIDRWMAVTRKTALLVVVHVGANCLGDARALAEAAQRQGAAGIAALSPSYYKPADVPTLVQCMAEIAEAAPKTPFYYYDIPPMTGVHLPMAEFLERGAEQIPNLAGLKFSNPDLMTLQRCLRVGHGKFAVFWGSDESLLAALALGATAAVGSTYNFAAPIFHRLLKAWTAGDQATAREEQFRAVRMVECLLATPGGFLSASKALMGLLGVPVGPARLPLNNLTRAQSDDLRRRLEEIGFFDWVSR